MPESQDEHQLERFVHAQDPVYETVLSELRRGRKQTHWMWFVFPQIAGLGHSPTARRFAIRSRAEAEAYAKHPVLGPRLRECTKFVLDHADSSVHDIFGSPDDLKFHSCITLFAEAGVESEVFERALKTFFAGRRDGATRERLDR